MADNVVDSDDEDKSDDTSSVSARLSSRSSSLILAPSDSSGSLADMNSKRFGKSTGSLKKAQT